jgi:DNA-binding NtrC family response regulator
MDVASNGADGLELLDRKGYDVVLLDLKMAGLSGDEVLKEIRQRNVNAKVIFITAFSDSGKTKERLMGEGAFAFVEKPVTSLKLLEDIVNMAVSTDNRDG